MRLYYSALRRLGLGAHIAVIIGLAAVPTSLFVIEFIDAERRDAVEDAEEWAQDAALHAAEHHRGALDGTRAVLETAADQLGIVGGRPCKAIDDNSDVVWLVDPHDPTCIGDPDFPLSDLIAIDIGKQSPEPGFAVLGPYVDSHKETHVYGVLTLRTGDGLTWHLIRPIEFTWTPTYSEELAEEPGLVSMVLDGQGRIFHRVGSFADVHTAAQNEDTWQELPVKSWDDAKTVLITDIDGVKRIFGIARLDQPDVTVLVGLSQSAVTATAERELVASLAMFAAVIALSALGAWLIIERIILRSIRLLRDAAVETADGAYGRRVDVSDGPIELRELADAFNEMTATLEYQAFHDQLTGLANRRYIEQHFEALLAAGRPFSVFSIDLDGFKPINDTHGHAVGDMVLAEVGKRLNGALDETCFVGRSGGDEFLLLVPSIEQSDELPEKAAFIAAGILECLSSPIVLDSGYELVIGGSIGIAFWPRDGETAEDMIRQADNALYEAKKSGKNRYFIMAGSASSKKRGSQAA